MLGAAIMNKRTIPSVVLGAVLAAGLLGACSSGTSDDTTTPSAASTAAETSAPAESATATAEATATSTAEASEAPAPVMQPSTLTLDVADGKASGTLVVAGSEQGVADAAVNLVFRPDSGDVTTFTATTDSSGAFSVDAAGTGAGSWTASFLGTDTAGPAAATAKVG